MTDSRTIFLRFEGPLQAWGDTSKFVIRRSMDSPTKSGVLGLICCAMGLSRPGAREKLPALNTLTMGVRIDRPGARWWDYHTVGAGIGLTTAAGGLKTGAQGTVIKRLEYLADASFLVALQGDAILIATVAEALRSPKWPLYLGRKSCPPSMPVFAQPRKDETWTNPMAVDGDIEAALQIMPWHPRYADDAPRDQHGKRYENIELPCLIEWRRRNDKDTAPPDAEVWYDTPFSFDPPVHHPRLVRRGQVTVTVGDALQQHTPPPPRPRADYNNDQYKKHRAERLQSDQGLCVFCKSPATTVQHVTYRRAGGNEAQEDLRSLCRLCHDAVTMIEYGMGMGLDRIDPCDVRWRDDILRTRADIIRFRSEETRRRALRSAPEKIRREALEEEDI
ncbi:MAG TPA: type I-E CRISPR-associated protein Cas5/CasD [Sedimentisphaerales bacterium]|nr:type I-E CRISPR-associated protein Cas5/CasD [Sedimentisphaerales bacterium]HRS13100.1 type I-E CRISPR-associated protein Cas5/CasD [Sedimentisphaerales bacterium]HRV46404.1 type I-E CRISPR-associated protein Cas5/CasD [Sedimentisphaerales bacterium]